MSGVRRTDRIVSRAALAVALVFSSAAPASIAGAQEAEPRAVSLRETAVALARAGAARGDARAVLAAAQLAITAGRASAGLEPLGSAARAPGDSLRPEERDKGDLSAAGLLRLAMRVAVEQQDVATANVVAELAGHATLGLGDAALATELRTTARALATTRGASGGPVWADGFLAANEVQEFRLSFQGGYTPNRVEVSASNLNADLDCYLYEGRQLVERDNGYGGGCTIRWSQRLGGALVLRIRNVGVGTYFVLLTN